MFDSGLLASGLEPSTELSPRPCPMVRCGRLRALGAAFQKAPSRLCHATPAHPSGPLARLPPCARRRKSGDQSQLQRLTAVRWRCRMVARRGQSHRSRDGAPLRIIRRMSRYLCMIRREVPPLLRRLGVRFAGARSVFSPWLSLLEGSWLPVRYPSTGTACGGLPPASPLALWRLASTRGGFDPVESSAGMPAGFLYYGGTLSIGT